MDRGRARSDIPDRECRYFKLLSEGVDAKIVQATGRDGRIFQLKDLPFSQ